MIGYEKNININSTFGTGWMEHDSTLRPGKEDECPLYRRR